MRFATEISRLLRACLLALALVAISAAYWALAGPSTLLQRDDNPRTVEALSRIERGSIYDRNNTLLADSVASNGVFRRMYTLPSTYSAVGYYSLRYGVSGAEAAFDAVLSGAVEVKTLSDFFMSNVLRLPQVGTDIRLTLNARIQDALIAAIGDQASAAVVMQAHSGEILALISAPTFNPNNLDDDWEQLVEAPDEPFFNRALQGNYQLGGNVYPLWLFQAIATEFDLSTRFQQASAPVPLVDDITVACVKQPPGDELTLAAALTYGCPAPFKSYWRQYVDEADVDVFTTFKFDSPFTLDGLPQPETVEPPPDATESGQDAESMALRNALGQGKLTTTPLHLATVMSALAADGAAPTPVILSAQRPPGDSAWVAPADKPSGTPMVASAEAQAVRQALAESWITLTEQASPPGVQIGAAIATSQSGADRQTWLTGFLRRSDRNSALAFVVLLERQVEVEQLVELAHELVAALLVESS